ncbi:hypothetical protein SCMU_19290 [Sinomonas cyclohexanicum]|uniref:Uncharacterized protein n=1 Tax=Sinomonas cyclohexanicum TaxID=322009 RepID=A0ABM7PVA2_SINCY|nr:hypothetical protein [Corynebacterium cyclohexanicum]BCT76087.1 hypothetical protein SCMU_19290 [Corynebacterium cyclohexanicum]
MTPSDRATRFAPLDDGDEWWLMTDRERRIWNEARALEDTTAYWRGWLDRDAQCCADHATVENRIDAAARLFLLMDAEEAHRRSGVRR